MNLHLHADESSESKVFIVDPDALSAKAAIDLVHSHRLAVEHFSSGEAFLAGMNSNVLGCAVLAVELPGIDGLCVQTELEALGDQLAVVLVSSQADIQTAVRAMKAGAVDYLQKPFQPLELWKAIEEALRVNRKRHHQRECLGDLCQRLKSLTDEERLVMQLVLDGKPNKNIANHLGLSVRTIDFRRAGILRKWAHEP